MSSKRQLKNGVMLSKDGWKDRIKYSGYTIHEGAGSRNTTLGTRLPQRLSPAVALKNPGVKKLININICPVTAQEREQGETK